MGYSATRDAINSLRCVGEMFATKDNPNVLTIKGEQFFFERGREQSDGAVTGNLYKLLPNDMCRKAGSVRIEGDGTITRFPGLTQVQREEAENSARDLEARNPDYLHSLPSMI